jgi:hypothetical protein
LSWAITIFYATSVDAELIRRFINDASEVAWIIKVAEQDQTYTWRAVNRLDAISEQQYALWHPGSGPLNVPSGSTTIPDTLVADPFAGWTQSLTESGATVPWFGSNPAPFSLNIHHAGRERPGSIARSEFAWAGDHFRPIGLPAAPAAKRWWQELTRFIKRHASAQPWPPETSSRQKAYVFPDAQAQVTNGRSLDVNPWSPLPYRAANQSR